MWHRAESAAELAVPARVRARAPPPLQPLHWIAFNGKWLSCSSLLSGRERHTLLRNSSKAPAWSALINTRKQCLVWEEKPGAHLFSYICFGCSVSLFLRHQEIPSAAAPPKQPHQHGSWLLRLGGYAIGSTWSTLTCNIGLYTSISMPFYYNS